MLGDDEADDCLIFVNVKPSFAPIQAFVLRWAGPGGRRLPSLATNRVEHEQSTRANYLHRIVGPFDQERQHLQRASHGPAYCQAPLDHDATREGTSTTSLDRDLGANRMATRHFLAYLKGHA